MKVKELIEKLKAVDQELEVYTMEESGLILYDFEESDLMTCSLLDRTWVEDTLLTCELTYEEIEKLKHKIVFVL
jgi:hypothetical protein